ncbi:hypothetical protein HK100_002127, partial [Physocladia obscura]
MLIRDVAVTELLLSDIRNDSKSMPMPAGTILELSQLNDILTGKSSNVLASSVSSSSIQRVTLSYYGGLVLSNVEITPIFYNGSVQFQSDLITF